MRLKAEAVFELWADDEQPQLAIVSEYRGEYKAISGILDEHPEIFEMAHQDLEELSKATTKRGRKADFTSENLLRAVIVMQREGLDYRDATVRIAESDTLQNFCRLRRATSGLQRRKGSEPRQGVQYLRTAYGTDHPRSAKPAD